jgi:hypothetical protein
MVIYTNRKYSRKCILSNLSLFDFTLHLQGLSQGLLFMSESDFPVEFITPPPMMKPQRSSSIADPLALLHPTSMVPKQVRERWEILASYIKANIVGTIAWKRSKTRADNLGSSNVEYVLLLLHSEGLVALRFRATET